MRSRPAHPRPLTLGQRQHPRPPPKLWSAASLDSQRGEQSTVHHVHFPEIRARPSLFIIRPCSFFDNKGAVAGVFSVVGVIVAGGILWAIIYAKRRAARLQDEEDMTYFEKYEAPNNNSTASFNDGAQGPEPEMSYAGSGGARGMDVNDEPLATHAAMDAYPDRATHFGLPTMDEYAQPSDMGLHFGNAGVDYPPGTVPNAGVEYPPGMSYDPAQYAGYEGGYGYTATEHQQPYYDSSNLAATSPTHPYANPSNSPRMPAAPPVQQPHYYGEAN